MTPSGCGSPPMYGGNMPDPDDIVYTDDGSVTIVAPIATAEIDAAITEEN